MNPQTPLTMIISAQSAMLLFIVANIVITFLWCVFARASRGVVCPEQALATVKRLSDGQAEQVTKMIKLIHGLLPYELPAVGAPEEPATASYTPKTYKMSKYDDIWEEMTKDMLIPIFEGENIDTGAPIWVDLTKELHGNRCGATGNGKSVDLRTLLECLARANAKTPLEVIAIDGKESELEAYALEKRIQINVLIDNESDEFHDTIKGLYMRMKKRQKQFRLAKCQKIEEYNTDNKGNEMPYIVLIIDEFSRIYKIGETKENKAYNSRITEYLVELIELGRAYGFIIQVTTQNPSSRSIPPSIFAQFITTKSYRLKRKTDSERVLSDKIAGRWAHQLKGKGVFLYQSASMSWCGLAPHTELSDAPFYPEYKGLKTAKGKYAEHKAQAKDFVLSLLKQKEEAIVSVEELAQYLSVSNDKKYRDSILMPVLADFPHKTVLKAGKRIHAYKIFTNQSKQNNNE